jgi:hypothetical protein
LILARKAQALAVAHRSLKYKPFDQLIAATTHLPPRAPAQVRVLGDLVIAHLEREVP